MSYRILQQAAEMRRSIYALNKQLPLSAAETAQIVEHAVKHTPSSFNSQSTHMDRFIKDGEGNLTLEITNVKSFWSMSKYLVVEVG